MAKPTSYFYYLGYNQVTFPYNSDINQKSLFIHDVEEYKSYVENLIK